MGPGGDSEAKPFQPPKLDAYGGYTPRRKGFTMSDAVVIFMAYRKTFCIVPFIIFKSRAGYLPRLKSYNQL
jgi:hypothetical protein